LNVALTDLTTNLPKSKNINHFTANASNAKLESFDQKFQDIVNGINNEGFRSNNAPTTEKKVITNNRDNPSIDLLIKTNEKSNNELLVIQNTNDSKDLIISNTKKDKYIKLNVDQLLLLIEASTKNTKNIDEKELLNQAQKILSSSKTQFTEEDKKVLQKAFSIIIKESKDSQGSNSEDSKTINSQTSLEGLIKHSQSTQTSLNDLIKHSKPTEETTPTLLQNNLHSKGSQESDQIVQADIQKLLQLIEESSKSAENKDEFNKSTNDIDGKELLIHAQETVSSPKIQPSEEDKKELLMQAQKILPFSKPEFKEAELEVLQKAFNIIMKESKVTQPSNNEDSKANNSQISLESLIKHSKPTEETPSTLSQNNLDSKGSRELNQVAQSDIQKLLQLIEESSINTENKNEINTLEQAQKILNSSKTDLTKEDKKVLLTQFQELLSSSKTQLTEEDKDIFQKAFNIIMKESKVTQPSNNEDSKANNSQISLESLIKHSKPTEETPSTLSQNNLDSKVSQESNQIVQHDIQKLLQLIEESSKSIENNDEINTLEQAQKILSSSKTDFTENEIEILERAADLIIKENKESNNKIPLEDLSRPSKTTEESLSTLSQKNLYSKVSQETHQISQSDIQKLLSAMKESSKSIESKDEINTLEQAKKILSSSKTPLTAEDKEVLQKAFNIIIKESKDGQGSNSEDSKAINSQISLESLIKPSKLTEETFPTLPQKNLYSKVSQETYQTIDSNLQKFLSTVEKSPESIESKNEINILEQVQKLLTSSKAELTEENKNELLIQDQKILSSSKTEITPDELNIIKTALGIINTNNPKNEKSSSNTLGETTLIANSLIKGNIDKTKNNKNENNDSIKAMQSDQKADLLNTKNNFAKNLYFDPYETRKNNVSKDKNSELQKDNTVKLAPTSNFENISKNLNIEQLKTDPSTNEIDLKSLQINKNNIQDGIPTTNLKDLNAQIKEVIISKNTQTFLNESFSVKISPPDLGKVDIQILKNGQAVTINISTETENAKNIISKTLQSLVGNLRDEGYQPISIKVNVTQEEHYLADQNQQHQQEQEQKKYNEEDHNGDQSEEGTYYTFDEYLRSDLNA
jgi:hypothetical protein